MLRHGLTAARIWTQATVAVKTTSKCTFCMEVVRASGCPPHAMTHNDVRIRQSFDATAAHRQTIMEKLSHPHIIRLLDSFSDARTPRATPFTVLFFDPLLHIVWSQLSLTALGRCWEDCAHVMEHCDGDLDQLLDERTKLQDQRVFLLAAHRGASN